MKFNRAIFLTILLVFFISGIWYVLNKNNLLNEIIGFIELPFWKTATFSGSKIRNFFEDYLVLVNLKKENERLKQEILILKSQLARYKERERLYKKLENFYKISFNLKYPKIPARIIYKSLDPYSGVIFIDKGSKNGIMPQMPVLAAAGGKAVALIGQVVEVYKNWSKVILLTHPSFAVDVKIVRTGDRGILKGQAEPYCTLQYLPSTAKVAPGDEVITSGQDALFPPDLLIGKIVSVKRDPVQAVFKVAEVKPLVDFYNLDIVFVLIKIPEIPL